MCDTLCSMSTETVKETVIFAKNSDRSPNEPHLVIRVKEQEYASGSQVKLTYITIPQVEHTFEAILCKPSWTWGAEMGVNSASVAIGNEAVFTKANRGPDALTGMDLVRLALERADTAYKAVECITDLLTRYGQGGNCGFDHYFYYDNSFLITDPYEGYVLETSGRQWVAEKIKNHQAISNRLSINKEHTLRGFVEEGFDFAGKLTEPIYTHFSGSRLRRNQALKSLGQRMDIEKMITALRIHNPCDTDRIFTHGSVSSVCMHAGGIVGDHTTGSLIAELRKNAPATLWCTAASTPCISAFKPVFFPVSSGAPVHDKEKAAITYWLDREAIHRGILNGTVDAEALRKRRDALEKEWIRKERNLFASGVPYDEDLLAFAKRAAEQEQEMVNEFIPRNMMKMPGHGRFQRYWNNKNASLGQI